MTAGKEIKSFQSILSGPMQWRSLYVKNTRIGLYQTTQHARGIDWSINIDQYYLFWSSVNWGENPTTLSNSQPIPADIIGIWPKLEGRIFKLINGRASQQMSNGDRLLSVTVTAIHGTVGPSVVRRWVRTGREKVAGGNHAKIMDVWRVIKFLRLSISIHL